MRIEKCYFCSGPVYPGHGSCFVRNDSKMFRFCRSKCKRNFEMKRNPRKVRWTKAFRKAAGKEMAVDSTFDFERKRNRIEKYDREKMLTVVKAIKKVNDIREKREADFYKNRMRSVKKKDALKAVEELKKDIHLIKSPAAVKQKVKLQDKAKESLMEDA
eukprot:TRINITY_DN1525_c0_g1::TRINITY_DN1525_c0_g1_i1::g.28196::m.28196 TRINITY_DN1525_c0_g1::TRINITY_DN1525_c0_g1_i1::g.28196  ORF type:complete len:183 (+),score=40.01,sp/Q3SZ12/RLP24_BOVIN/57.59/7e-60,Ribosomal_L24e/PF01246.15/1.2e-29,Phosphorylase/PF00343.15/0.0037 TRINITY_DN1525_c0_g1_i1:74-550(+)